MPGQIGLIQAAEAIKFITGKGKPLIGRFLTYDALDADFKVFTVKKNESCPLCGGKPSIKDLSPEHYRQETACLI